MKQLFHQAYRFLKASDAPLLLGCLGASLVSLFMLSGIVHSGLTEPRRFWVQLIALALGLIAAVVVSLFDYHFMARMWKIHVPVALLLVLLTFVIGAQRGGADDKAWLILPFGMSFQPSELLKVSFILSFAYHLSLVRETVSQPKTLALLCLHGAAPVLLIHLQGDDGTALIFAAIFVGMLFAAGLEWRYILGAAGAVLAALPILWFFIFSEDQRNRILTVLNPELDPQGIGYQQITGQMAIGSGSVFGSGVYSGSHVYVPEIQNDFIFSFIGNATGFIGCLGVIVLLAFLCYQVLRTGTRAKDPLGLYICAGVFSQLAAQIIANLGMCLGVLPVIGLTLPFISAGGTSVVTLYMSLGLVLSVYRYSSENIFNK